VLGSGISKPRPKLASLISLSFWGFAGGLVTIVVSGLFDVPFLIVGLKQLSSRLLAPIWEEMMKATVIFAFFAWNKLGSITQINRDLMTLFGLVVGLSFAAIENIGYINQYNIPLDVVVKRGFSTWDMHIVAAFLSSYGLKESYNKKKIWILPYLAVAILIHLVMNNGDIILQFIS